QCRHWIRPRLAPSNESCLIVSPCPFRQVRMVAEPGRAKPAQAGLVHRLRPAAPAAGENTLNVRSFFGLFRYSPRAIELVWSTSRALTLAIAALTVVAGTLPAAVAYVGSLIVDAVVTAIRASGANATQVIELVILEGALVATIAAAQRGLSLCQSLL